MWLPYFIFYTNLTNNKTTLWWSIPREQLSIVLCRIRVTSTSNQGNRGRETPELLVCVQEILICTHCQGGGLVLYSHANILMGTLAPGWDHHFGSLSYLYSTDSAIGDWKITHLTLKMMGFIGQCNKRPCLVSRCFMMCKWNIVQCIYKILSDIEKWLIDVCGLDECLAFAYFIK